MVPFWPSWAIVPLDEEVDRRKETEMIRHIGFIHGSKLEPFSPPSFCQSGAGLEQYTYYYHKGYRQTTGKPYYAPEQKSERMAP